LALELIPAGPDGQGPSPGKGPVLVAPAGPSGLYERLKSAAAGLNITLQTVPALESMSAAGLADRDSDVVTLALPVEFLHTPSELINWADAEAAVRLLKALVSGVRDGGAK
jgi:putative aminopeptidase FrvX